MFGSAYGPSGDTPADQVERDDLFTTLGSAVGGAAERKVLLIGVVLAVVRMARRTTVSRVRGEYFQDGRVPTGTTAISKRGEATR